MDLTDSQKVAVTAWVQGGKSLAEVQNQLREEFDLSLTYMDVRFLVDDLDIIVEEPEEADVEESDASAEALAEEPEVLGGVHVEVNPVTPPGALVAGTVRFSDGKSLGWQLSAAGQLGLVPGDDPDYRPSPEDVQEFQAQLQEVLQKQGY